MSKFTFICEDEPMPFSNGSITKKTFEFECVHIDDVVAEFETFLRGCGFHFEGRLELCNNEQTNDNDLDAYTEKLFHNE